MTHILERVNYCLIVNIAFIRPHPMVPTMLLLFGYIVYLEGFIGSTFALMNDSFGKSNFFHELFLSALSLSSIPTKYYTLQ